MFMTVVHKRLRTFLTILCNWVKILWSISALEYVGYPQCHSLLVKPPAGCRSRVKANWMSWSCPISKMKWWWHLIPDSQSPHREHRAAPGPGMTIGLVKIWHCARMARLTRQIRVFVAVMRCHGGRLLPTHYSYHTERESGLQLLQSYTSRPNVRCC